ncbi:MAG: HAD hydrolase family protein, partial [Selenomonadaceae bacterium]|nr:HAD hydrolase family protein [Selenomonadaceae bacterium]
VSKASGLRELAKILNISIEETMAIGDADNDLPMLKAAGKSVAMGNAAAHIKEAADFVTADCADHGFAKAIYKFVLGEG